MKTCVTIQFQKARSCLTNIDFQLSTEQTFLSFASKFRCEIFHSCVVPGMRDPAKVDADLNYGVSYSYGYSSESCAQVSISSTFYAQLLLEKISKRNKKDSQIKHLFALSGSLRH